MMNAHGSEHCARGEMIDKILRQQGFWFINMQNKISKFLSFLSECDMYMKRNVKPAVHPMCLFPSVEGPFVHLVMDFVDMIHPIKEKMCFLEMDRSFNPV